MLQHSIVFKLVKTKNTMNRFLPVANCRREKDFQRISNLETENNH
jgi:hypothetical protein